MKDLNVHIVWVTPDGDRIVDRLARMLARETGWSLSDRPDGRADLNYFMLYIDFAQRFSDWHATPTAAYFSHFEPDTPYKRYWWEAAAQQVDVKVVTARQYAEILPGKVILATPPVEGRFVPMEHSAHDLPRIGVSGYVDRSGRKGEQLVAFLAEELEGRAEVVASGQGWPARRVNGSLEGLPAFYGGLDLYLCASTIEGIPMPPLEALACGRPVVIPRHVGMLDDLPETPGIYRYEAGDYKAMRAAVEGALGERGQIEVENLRAAVRPYTPEAWAASHREGFEAALSGRAVPVLNDRKAEPAESAGTGQRGVYYVAYGEPARKCAQGAIESFKHHIPEIPVALVSDLPLGPEDIFIEQPDLDIGGRMAKVQIYDLAPAEWEYVAYLDADTEIVAGETLLWDAVQDGWDLVICKNPGRFHVAREMRRPDNEDECEETFRQLGTDELLQLNGGVFAFRRNARTRDFFAAWAEEWRRYGKRDQAALLRALNRCPVKMYVLGNQWNTVTRYDSAENAAWLLHYPMTARRWRGTVHYRLDDPKAWEAVKEFEGGRK